MSLGTASDGDSGVLDHPDSARPSNRFRPRTFEVVYTLLTLHFASLAVTYLVDPDSAVRQFSRANKWLGGERFAPPEVTAWRYATVCGMSTLAVMTFLMLVDLRQNYPLLVPAAFFKILNAVLWFWYSATNRDLPVFVAAGVFDLIIVIIMVWVARRAYAAAGPVAATDRSGTR
jgi:hypothetical protein